MYHFRTERKAVYDTAKFFTEYGWIFREQPVVDLGVDALVETPIDGNGQIKVFALQIKGGESNFFRKKNYLTFYFSERHYHYWNAICENYPLYIILQDNSTENIYWQEYNENYITKTSKNWKLDIPLENLLTEDSKKIFIDTLFKSRYNKSIKQTFSTPIQQSTDELIISYFNSTEKETIHIILEYKKEVIILDLFYKLKKKEWDKETAFLSWESQYHYSLADFKRYIHFRFDTMKKNKSSFNNLATEVESIINGSIENVQEFMFDYNNIDNAVPKYSNFLKAFEFYSKLGRKQYEAQALDFIIHIKTKKESLKLVVIKALRNI